MAKLADLVKVLVEMDGRGFEPVDWLGRKLRDAGLLPNAGRGRPAADLTAAHAANLLIGWTASDSAAEAAELTTAFRDMTTSSSTAQLDPVFWKRSPIAERIMTAANFGEAVERLIESTKDLAKWQVSCAPARARKAAGMDRTLRQTWSAIEVSMTRHGNLPTSAEIMISHVAFDKKGEMLGSTIDIQALFLASPDSAGEIKPKQRPFVRRKVQTSIDGIILDTVSSALFADTIEVRAVA